MSLWHMSQPFFPCSPCKACTHPRLPALSSVSLLRSRAMLKQKWAGGAGGAACTEIIKCEELVEWILWMKNWIQRLFQYLSWMFITPKSLIVVFSEDCKEQGTLSVALTGLFYPLDIRRWHRLKRTHPHDLFSSKGNKGKGNKGKKHLDNN